MGLVAKRAEDFRDTGNYHVEHGGGTAKIYRDPETGYWFEDVKQAHLHSPHEHLLGFTKQEALSKLERLHGPPKESAAGAAASAGVQTGPKGGSFVITATGRKVYRKG